MKKQPKQVSPMVIISSEGETAIPPRPVRNRMMQYTPPPHLPDILSGNGSYIITVKDGIVVESQALEDNGKFVLTVNSRRVTGLAAVEKPKPLPPANNGDEDPGGDPDESPDQE